MSSICLPTRQRIKTKKCEVGGTAHILRARTSMIYLLVACMSGDRRSARKGAICFVYVYGFVAVCTVKTWADVNAAL